MKNAKVFSLAIAIALVPFPWLLPSIGDAQVTVNCDAGERIQDAINSFGGGTIFVTGTCNESIGIGPFQSGLTLDGLPAGAPTMAKIFSQTPDFNPEARPLQISAAVFVNGATNVTIRNFIITGDGTSDGPNIVDGARVQLQNNIIEKSFREGVFVRFSIARIFGNTIQNNGGDGIFVTENSAARIGFSSTDDGFVRPNMIQGNKGNGISVLRSSTARIVGNTAISGNVGHGISVSKNSHADIASNEISANGGDGINLRENSAVNLGSAASADTDLPPLATVFTGPNSTTALNTGFGIRCSVGGSASGPVGSLNGSGGVRRFEGNCVNDLSR